MKQIKTIMFIALFAAMILSFSGMQSVDALHEETHDSNRSQPHGEETDKSHLPGDAEMTAPYVEVIRNGSHLPVDEVEVIRNGTSTPYYPGVPDMEVIPDGTHGEEIVVISEGSSEMEVVPTLDGSNRPISIPEPIEEPVT